MSDILIRDVPEGIVTAIDGHARRLGLSRNEYLRRKLAQDAQRDHVEVTTADIARFSDAVSELGSDEVMREAWM